MAVPLAIVGDSERFASDASRPYSFASPKSRILGFPSAVTLMFAGFKSRWMTPFSCAALRPSAISLNNASVLSTGMGLLAICCASVSPSMISITRHRVSPEVSSPWSVAMLGWFKEARSLASLSFKRDRE